VLIVPATFPVTLFPPTVVAVNLVAEVQPLHKSRYLDKGWTQLGTQHNLIKPFAATSIVCMANTAMKPVTAKDL